MSFVDELYNPINKTLPKDVWLRTINDMENEIRKTVSAEHANGNHYFSGYFSWWENYCILSNMNHILWSSYVLDNTYPIEEMCQELNDRLKTWGFITHKVYSAEIMKYNRHKNIFGMDEYKKWKLVKTICIELKW